MVGGGRHLQLRLIPDSISGTVTFDCYRSRLLNGGGGYELTGRMVASYLALMARESRNHAHSSLLGG